MIPDNPVITHGLLKNPPLMSMIVLLKCPHLRDFPANCAWIPESGGIDHGFSGNVERKGQHDDRASHSRDFRQTNLGAPRIAITATDSTAQGGGRSFKIGNL